MLLKMSLCTKKKEDIYLFSEWLRIKYTVGDENLGASRVGLWFCLRSGLKDEQQTDLQYMFRASAQASRVMSSVIGARCKASANHSLTFSIQPLNRFHDSACLDYQQSTFLCRRNEIIETGYLKKSTLDLQIMHSSYDFFRNKKKKGKEKKNNLAF